MVTSNVVRCKMECTSFMANDNGTSEVIFSPVIEGSKENESFFKYTPAGELNLIVDNTNVSFVVGKEYYIDIIDSEVTSLIEVEQFILGQEVQDKYTKFKGTIIGIAHYLHEADNICIQSNGLKNGKPLEAEWLPVSRIESTPQKKEQ